LKFNVDADADDDDADADVDTETDVQIKLCDYLHSPSYFTAFIVINRSLVVATTKSTH
jgi:hypothetical protein